ncbi:hypothetical protein [Ramlibacter tataouinensis]|uniref:Uncharacterized protein n=1 Tax=Ramlibacter tataouinensis (strain ATCC BAA-407 / DSM 14655 / LMG 21543 / TTB310) TaxID=365046 RepID=F5XVJ1_RAMTT|nr:hypothetical protein [Ramlibacter tataouinensis]AEG91567.1 Hypothetical protein Rta_04910 [Ramlibacter tataouinensis TTB310]
MQVYESLGAAQAPQGLATPGFGAAPGWRRRPVVRGVCVLVLAAAAGLGWRLWTAEPLENIPLNLNMEHRDARGGPINPSTQSVNRYSSVLDELTRIPKIQLAPEGTRFSLQIASPDGGKTVNLENLDAYQMVPILPYATAPGGLDDFDRANLMLAEFGRNGLMLAYQARNSTLAYFNDLPRPFLNAGGEEDYTTGQGGAIVPNKLARPKRFSITNNCLKAGLWELSATDAVGEMYHAWFNMPWPVYAEMIRRANGIDLPDREIISALKYRGDITSVPADLGRLRTEGPLLFQGKAKVSAGKQIGSYSSQESRQKSQNKYFEVTRGFSLFGAANTIDAKTFADLEAGDIFSTRKFVNPGIYSGDEKKTIPFDPFWEDVEVRSVKPLTRFRDGKPAAAGDEFLEISVYAKDRQRRIVMGNIPLALLVDQEDYLLPSFGVGVNPPAEFAERRHLRLKDGPVPHYGYQTVWRDGQWRLENNHEGGVEQMALRVFTRGERTFLRVTFVAYERILDLLELEVEITEPLAQKLRASSSAYQPPLFRSYEDVNII